MRRGPGILVGLAVVALVAGACGVEVPDDVADRATSTTSTTQADATTTTDLPTSDDALEQALLDNGYTRDEASCGADRLRDDLGADQLAEITGADDIDDIDDETGAAFAASIEDCVEDGTDERSTPGG